MTRWFLDFGWPIGWRALAIASWLSLSGTATVHGQEPTEKEAPAAETKPAASEPAPAGSTAEATGPAAEIRADFANFLHFAVIGQFEIADGHAAALLKRPDMNPLSKEAADLLVALSQQYENSIETLIILVNNSSISQNASKVLAKVREAHRRKRMDASRIESNIRLLAGTPTQRATGLERLIDSGEYAVPKMLEILAEPGERELQAFVTRAMPQLGKPAVNPLVAALSVKNAAIQCVVAETLGRIGYPQALAYLNRLANDEQANQVSRQAARAAIGKIVVVDPRVKKESAAEMFAHLAERYYVEDDSLRPDPRENRANVWFAQGETVKSVDVPREIFCMVMCMRSCEAALAIRNDDAVVYALWLAANFRRESRLGLDVQTAEAADADDPSRPPNYPRGVYFAGIAGPRRCQSVLNRAMRDRDRDVALGAIAGLRATAGPAALTEKTEAGSLADALQFPDLLVRIKVALALGGAMPAEPFHGANDVVPVLASALSLSAQKTYLVVDPDTGLAEKLRAKLAESGANVLAADRLGAGLTAAGKQPANLDGVFLASDIDRPTPVEAIQTLAKDGRFALAPIVLYVKQGGIVAADKVAEADSRVGRVLVVSDGDQAESLARLLLAKRKDVAGRFGYRELSPEAAAELALNAAATLEAMAGKGSSVFEVRAAETALIEALAHPSEPLRIAAAKVLALINTNTAQSAIARIALGPEQTQSLRMALFASLAESARRFGPYLEDAPLRELTKQTMSEPNLDLRTAASLALGAMNLAGDLPVQSILGQPRKE